MDKGIWMFGAILLLLSAAVAVLGQAQEHTGPSNTLSSQTNISSSQAVGRTIAPPPASFAARLGEAARLDNEAASDLDSGDYAGAEDAARHSIALGIVTGKNQMLLAQALNAQGKTDEALKMYQVIVVDQGSDAARNLVPFASLLLQTGHWEMAVDVYNKALKSLGDGGVTGGQVALASTYGNFSPAVLEPKRLQKALHIAQGIVYSTLSWGRNSQDDKMLAEYQKARTLEPSSALGNLYYAHGLKRMGRVKEARAVLQETVQTANGPVKAAAEQELKSL